jgi:hypothetical protein
MGNKVMSNVTEKTRSSRLCENSKKEQRAIGKREPTEIRRRTPTEEEGRERRDMRNSWSKKNPGRK